MLPGPIRPHRQHMTVSEQGAAPWQRAMGRELTWLLALKFVALILLWWLCFSPAHRTRVDGAATGRQLGLMRDSASVPGVGESQPGVRP